MQWITQAIIDLVDWVLNILPDSPFLILDTMNRTEFYQYIKWVNWFLPVGLFIQILSSWCAAILVYYVFQIILRWAKAIE